MDYLAEFVARILRCDSQCFAVENACDTVQDLCLSCDRCCSARDVRYAPGKKLGPLSVEVESHDKPTSHVYVYTAEDLRSIGD